MKTGNIGHMGHLKSGHFFLTKCLRLHGLNRTLFLNEKPLFTWADVMGEGAATNGNFCLDSHQSVRLLSNLRTLMTSQLLLEGRGRG